MSSPKFERVKRSNPGVAKLFDKLGAYISSQFHQGQEFVLPKLAAVALGIRDGEAYVLLEMLAHEKLLQGVYNVYCRRTDALIATVSSLRELDDAWLCDECGQAHDPSDLRVEIAFRGTAQDLDDLAA